METRVSESQAVQIATEWIKNEQGQPLSLNGVFYKSQKEAGGLEGYHYDQPARWLISFDYKAPEGFEPNHTDVYVDVETGEVYAPRMM
jgi:hypothetical protein